MKILLFTDSLGSGGAQRQLIGLAVLLKNNGYEVKVCTYHDIDFYKYYLDDNQVKNELIPNAIDVKKRIWNVFKYFKGESPHYVIAYQETPSLIACICKILGCKYRLIVSERNTTQYIGFKEKIRFFLYRWANSIVPNSKSQEKLLLSYDSRLRNKITTISNFVDLNKFSPSYKKKSVFPLIVIAATIWPSKNVKGLIEAVRILVQEKLQFKIEWYGIIHDYKDYLDECRNLIEKYNLKSYIELLPKTKQIDEKYIECDFFCLPSFYEGLPNVICEAMACGRPILCSNICDNPIYVEENVNGYLFNPKDPMDIALKIRKALDLDNENYQKMCKYSRMRAEKIFSENVFLAKYVNLLK